MLHKHQKQQFQCPTGRDAWRHLAGLEPDTEYLVKVRSSNSAGAGEWSQPVLFRTGPSPPSCPLHVTASGAFLPPHGALSHRVEPDAGEEGRRRCAVSCLNEKSICAEVCNVAGMTTLRRPDLDSRPDHVFHRIGEIGLGASEARLHSREVVQHSACRVAAAAATQWSSNIRLQGADECSKP